MKVEKSPLPKREDRSLRMPLASTIWPKSTVDKAVNHRRSADRIGLPEVFRRKWAHIERLFQEPAADDS